MHCTVTAAIAGSNPVHSVMKKEKIQSPCIKKCHLHDDGYCVGCFRTLEEITTWRDLTDEEQAVIFNRIREYRIAANCSGL